MHASAMLVGDDYSERSPSFTLATALGLLGHDCPLTGPPLATECRCSAWVSSRACDCVDGCAHHHRDLLPRRAVIRSSKQALIEAINSSASAPTTSTSVRSPPRSRSGKPLVSVVVTSTLGTTC